MLPTLLITLREVIEASLIVATILGILAKLHQKEHIKTVWIAALSALAISFLLVFGGSSIGINIQKLYEGRLESMIEGILFVISAFFVTWAVFVIHKRFARKKMHMLQTVKGALANYERRGIFILTFAAVLREGIEIALFLSTVYMTTTRPAILGGFALGVAAGLLVSGILFSATVRMPVYWVFRTTSFLLILFAGGFLARGLGEFLALSPIATPVFTVGFLPPQSTLIGGVIETVFGVTRSMHALQLVVYSLYIYLMHWWVFVRPQPIHSRCDYFRGD